MINEWLSPISKDLNATSVKKLGIIGGMSDQSTLTYYKRINDYSKLYLGGHNTPEIILRSLNFQKVEDYLKSNNWHDLESYISDSMQDLRAAGADYFILACNSVHEIAYKLELHKVLPLLSIVDVLGLNAKHNFVSRLGVLGTEITMNSNGNYRKHLHRKYDVQTFTPSVASDRKRLHNILFDELCHGKVLDSSRIFLLQLIRSMKKEFKLDGIALACTELHMLIDENNLFDMSIFDTTELHIKAAIKTYWQGNSTAISKLHKSNGEQQVRNTTSCN